MASDLQDWIDPRGLRLSDRIWRNRQVVRNQIAQTLRTHLAEGRSTQETAMALQRYVNPDYGGNAYSGAERLVITETSRAHALQTKQTAQDDPAVRLLKRFTSPGHPRQDECDNLANRDVGYGPGIYLIDDTPLPPTHPRCSCGAELHRVPEDMPIYARRLRVEYGLDEEPTNLSPADLVEWRRQIQELKDQVAFLFRGWTRQTGLVSLDELAVQRATVKSWVAEVKQAKAAGRLERLITKRMSALRRTKSLGDTVETVVNRAAMDVQRAPGPMRPKGRRASRPEEVQFNELGIKRVDLGRTNVELRPYERDAIQLVHEALAELHDMGYAMPDQLFIGPAKNLGVDVPGAFTPVQSSLKSDGVLRTRLQFNTDQMAFDWSHPSASMRRGEEAAWFSTGDPRHIVRHEAGHFVHWNETKVIKPNRYGAEKVFTDETRYASTWEGALDQKAVAQKVSRYAATNPREFVAETFAGLLDGKTFDEDVMALYRHYGGPDVPPRH